MVYFHKRRIAVGGAFCGVYYGICKHTVKSENELLRIGIAGSLANMIIETVFHIVDTVNIRSKVLADNKSSTWQQVRQIYTKEGVYGFGRGFSACFYGSIFCGFSYFYLYKLVKHQLHDRFGEKINPNLVFILAAIVAESLTLLVHFPYDLIKCRLQSKNFHFKYKNLPHAFSKEVRNNGVMSLYQGALPFFFTYVGFMTMQFSIYEGVMYQFKHSMTPEKYH